MQVSGKEIHALGRSTALTGRRLSCHPRPPHYTPSVQFPSRGLYRASGNSASVIVPSRPYRRQIGQGSNFADAEIPRNTRNHVYAAPNRTAAGGNLLPALSLAFKGGVSRFVFGDLEPQKILYDFQSDFIDRLDQDTPTVSGTCRCRGFAGLLGGKDEPKCSNRVDMKALSACQKDCKNPNR